MNEQVLPKVLVVEDQLNWRRLYKIWLKNSCLIDFCTNRSEAIKCVENNFFDVVIMDLGLPEPEDGILTIKDILAARQNCKIIVVSAYTSRGLQLRVQKLGVYAVFHKDERLESELPVFVRKAYEMISLERENLYLRNQFDEKNAKCEILGNSKAAENLRQQVKSISRVETPILITGPTGSGKNYFAKLIHLLSPRSKKPFMAINCPNFSPNLVESELFGHVRGAYTGATTSRVGKFKLADGGTILLDEISEIPISIQAKLLQVIEDKNFYPLGSRKQMTVDVRIIASSNRDLRREIQSGNFREDLFFRLAGFRVQIPPLAERKEDIALYFDYFINHICKEEGIRPPEIDRAVYQTIQDLPWQGNLRELKSLVIRLLIFHPDKISSRDIIEQNITSTMPLVEKAIQKEYNLKQFSALYARELYYKLSKKKEVARILNVDSKTLNRYLEMQVE